MTKGLAPNAPCDGPSRRLSVLEPPARLRVVAVACPACEGTGERLALKLRAGVGWRLVRRRCEPCRGEGLVAWPGEAAEEDVA